MGDSCSWLRSRLFGVKEMTISSHFTREKWPRVAHLLKPVLGNYFEQAKVNVETGKEHLFSIDNYSVCLLRAEGLEVVVVGFLGVDRLSKCAPVIAELAREMGAKSIRLHTKRKGECLFLRRVGLPFFVDEKRQDEYVLRMFIDGWR